MCIGHADDVRISCLCLGRLITVYVQEVGNYTKIEQKAQKNNPLHLASLSVPWILDLTIVKVFWKPLSDQGTLRKIEMISKTFTKFHNQKFPEKCYGIKIF